jgi:hypothetical protein
MDEFHEIREFIKQSYTFKNKKQYYNLNQKLKKMDRDDIVTQSVIIAYRAQKLNTRLMGQYVKITKKLNKAEDDYLELLGKEGFLNDKIERLEKDLKKSLVLLNSG